MEAFAENCNEIMTRLKIPSAHVIGKSMGGMIAQVFASKFPRKVKKLVFHQAKLAKKDAASQRDMEITGIKCTKCDAELVHENLAKDDGSTVGVAQCPNGHGKVKSPMCCGHDMGNA